MKTGRGSEEVLGKGLLIDIYQQHPFTIVCGIGLVDNTIHCPQRDLCREAHDSCLHSYTQYSGCMCTCVHACMRNITSQILSINIITARSVAGLKHRLLQQ